MRITNRRICFALIVGRKVFFTSMKIYISTILALLCSTMVFSQKFEKLAMTPPMGNNLSTMWNQKKKMTDRFHSPMKTGFRTVRVG